MNNNQQIIIIEELKPIDNTIAKSYVYDKANIESKYKNDFYINETHLKLDKGKLFLLLVCTPKNKRPSEYKDIKEILPSYLLVTTR